MKITVDQSVPFPYIRSMKLKDLSDDSLHSRLLSLAAEERQINAQVLWHLKEVDVRKLFSEHRCSSLFDYCVSKLGYSEGEASRRVSACRLLREVPEVAKKIEDGDLTLTQASMANRFFQNEEIKKPEEKLEILEMISGMTTRQSEQVLSELRKEEGPRKVQLTLNEETLERLRRLKESRAHVFSDYDELVMKMCEEMEKVWRPEAKRRSTKTEGAGRYVPVNVKAAVWKRDGGRCQWCGSVRALEYDHVKPAAMGGKTSADNLQLLCRNCNQRKGLVQFGNFRRQVRR